MKTEAADQAAPVTRIYFDSALVAKFYLNEPGRDLVRRLAQTAGIVVTSGIAVAEISAAFHRKLRERSVDQRLFNALQSQFKVDLDRYLWRLVPCTAALIEDVHALFSKLPKAVFLRSLDALHLVTARAEGFSRIYSNDRHLLAACPTAGLRGINPLA